MKAENSDPSYQYKEKTKRFHQFVKIQRGPVNALISDLLTGNLYHVAAEVIDKFESGDFSKIEDFLHFAQEENLIIEINPTHWIPEIKIAETDTKKDTGDLSLELHVEEGLDLNEILEAFQGYSISKVYFYGENPPVCEFKEIKIEKKQKNFNRCKELASVHGEFRKTKQSVINFNKNFNSCWGLSIAITADGIIRPCIYSRIEIGFAAEHLNDIENLLEKMIPYWTFTKNKVDQCKDCEFNLICFDCREHALRKSNSISARNPLCKYNPYTGEWGD